MMRWLQWLMTGLCLFALSSCSDREMEEREKVLGYAGRARINPYLAAERYLKAADRAVVSTSGTLRFDEDEAVVFSPASSVRSLGDAERVLDWVENGGHFVCFVERGEDYWQDVGEWADHSPELWSNPKDSTSGLDFLLESLELEMERVAEKSDEGSEVDSKEDTEEDSDNYDWDPRLPAIAKGEELPNSEELKVYVSEEKSFVMQLGSLLRLKDVEGLYYPTDWHDSGETHQFFSRVHESGRVTFIADGRAFRNPYLKIADHADMLDHLAASPGKVVFSLGKVRGFMSMLREYAWMALYGLLLVTVLWLWKNIPRFGPLLGVEEGHARNYAQQVKNAGNFLWRNKCDDALLQPLRDAVVRKSGHGYMETHDTSELIEKLSVSSGLDAEIISEAMTRTEVRDANSMVKICKTLQHLLKSL